MRIEKALGGFLALTLVAGIAWALESQTVTTPTGNEFVVVATITPGSGGATVYGPGIIHDDLDDCFSVRFEDDFVLSINGTSGPSFSPTSQFTVTASFTKVNGDWFVDTVVTDSNSNVVMAQTDYALPQAVGQVTAEAQTVHSLSAQ